MEKSWHTFDFPEFQTEGRDNSPEKLKFIEMPKNLEGMTVLDIGAWDGYFSFSAEKRGAKVLAIDSYEWQEGHEKRIQDLCSDPNRTIFNKVHELLKSKVEFVEENLNDIDVFDPRDLVLCLGILYHVEDPFTFIKKLNKITKKLLILETLTDGNIINLDGNIIDMRIPLMVFYPKGYLNDDTTTYWGPNVYCLIAMLIKAGFKKVRVLKSSELFPSRICLHAYKEGFDETSFS